MILVARWPNGCLQAQWVDPTPEQDARFRVTMTRQGCVVTQYSDAEYREHQRQRQAQMTVQVPPVTAPPSMTDCADTGSNFSPPSHPVWDAGNDANGLTLPEVGVELVHPVIGWATVTHTVTSRDSVAIPVATGPRGQGLVRAGQWRVAAENDRPYWMKDAVLESPAPPPPPQAKASAMQTLF